MQIQLNNNYNNPNFGVMISTETVRRANRACIERGKLARLQGMTLKEYNTLHREDFVKRIGAKTFDFYAMGERLTSDIEKLKKAFGEAWDKVVSKK